MHRFLMQVTYESRTYKVCARVEPRFRRGKQPQLVQSVAELDSDP